MQESGKIMEKIISKIQILLKLIFIIERFILIKLNEHIHLRTHFNIHMLENNLLLLLFLFFHKLLYRNQDWALKMLKLK